VSRLSDPSGHAPVPDPRNPPPISIPPPTQVRVAATVVLIEAAALIGVGALTLASGLSNEANTGQLVAQVVYYLVLAGAVAAVATGLLRGRRWARTPAIVVQLITVGVGFYLAAPSGHPGWGVPVAAVSLVTAFLLVGKAAGDWIRRFPPLFGRDPSND
jgi:Na+-driven multidrug efflux pump